MAALSLDARKRIRDFMTSCTVDVLAMSRTHQVLMVL